MNLWDYLNHIKEEGKKDDKKPDGRNESINFDSNVNDLEERLKVFEKLNSK